MRFRFANVMRCRAEHCRQPPIAGVVGDPGRGGPAAGKAHSGIKCLVGGGATSKFSWSSVRPIRRIKLPLPRETFVYEARWRALTATARRERVAFPRAGRCCCHSGRPCGTRNVRSAAAYAAASQPRHLRWALRCGAFSHLQMLFDAIAIRIVIATVLSMVTCPVSSDQ